MTKKNSESTQEEIEARRIYYREYYQRKKAEKGKFISNRRGRKPDPKPPPFKITKLKTPIIITFD